MDNVNRKFAWIYSEDKHQAYNDSYHRDINSFEEVMQHLRQSFADWITYYSLKIEDVNIIGTISLGDTEQPHKDKVLTESEIENIVLNNGVCKFQLERIVPDKDGNKRIQGWGAIYTMECLDEEENVLKQILQQEAQVEADRTGKKATVYNGVGWVFEAEPQVVNAVAVKAKKTKKSKK